MSLIGFLLGSESNIYKKKNLTVQTHFPKRKTKTKIFINTNAMRVLQGRSAKP